MDIVQFSTVVSYWFCNIGQVRLILYFYLLLKSKITNNHTIINEHSLVSNGSKLLLVLLVIFYSVKLITILFVCMYSYYFNTFLVFLIDVCSLDFSLLVQYFIAILFSDYSSYAQLVVLNTSFGLFMFVTYNQIPISKF